MTIYQRPRIMRKRQPSAGTKIGWKILAYYLDACNCDWGCPCQFDAKPTHGYCDGVSAIHIIDGSYGNDVKLDGLNMALIGSWRLSWHSLQYLIFKRLEIMDS
jgi:hypothetical protein